MEYRVYKLRLNFKMQRFSRYFTLFSNVIEMFIVILPGKENKYIYTSVNTGVALSRLRVRIFRIIFIIDDIVMLLS